MDWTRSNTLGLSKNHCGICRGVGLRRREHWGTLNPCNCVLRAIFSACYHRFLICDRQEKFVSKVWLTRNSSSARKASFAFARIDEDYVCDFYLVSKRELREEPGLWALFSAHFLLGCNWRESCRALKLNRGEYFHAVYRIEQRLGRAFRELEPYALFPLDEYFTLGNHYTKPAQAAQRPRGRHPRAERAPLAKQAVSYHAGQTPVLSAISPGRPSAPPIRAIGAAA